MIKINLLPYRQNKEQNITKRFFVFFGAAFGLAIASILAIHFFYQVKITIQEQRNTKLTTEMQILDKQIEDIKDIQKDISAANDRRNIVENLQANRTRSTKLLNELAIPGEGISYKSIIQKDNTITITGYALSNANIASWFKHIETTDILKNPDLKESKSLESNLKEFIITATLKDYSEELASKEKNTGRNIRRNRTTANKE